VLHPTHFTATTVSVSLFVVGIQNADGREARKPRVKRQVGARIERG
jgi:hypothetical protein